MFFQNIIDILDDWRCCKSETEQLGTYILFVIIELFMWLYVFIIFFKCSPDTVKP